MEVRTRVIVLQHPQEQDRELGTVPILERALGATKAVGLSWPNLGSVVGEGADPRAWAVSWPAQLPRPLAPAEAEAPAARLGGEAPLVGILALDGTWSQAKALWWRNPWLLKLDRIVLNPTSPSIYGRMRREPRRTYLSTLESVTVALVEVAGEDPALTAALHRAMRTMVQRARDAGVTG